MPGLLCGAARDAPPPPGQTQEEAMTRLAATTTAGRSASPAATSGQSGHQTTRVRTGVTQTSSRKPQPAPPRAAGRAPAADFSLELAGAEQTVAAAQAQTSSRRSRCNAGPKDLAKRSRSAPGARSHLSRALLQLRNQYPRHRARARSSSAPVHVRRASWHRRAAPVRPEPSRRDRRSRAVSRQRSASGLSDPG